MEERRIRENRELRTQYEDTDMTAFVQSKRRGENHTIKRVWTERPVGTIVLGIRMVRWTDQVLGDLWRLGMSEDRNQWLARSNPSGNGVATGVSAFYQT